MLITMITIAVCFWMLQLIVDGILMLSSLAEDRSVSGRALYLLSVFVICLCLVLGVDKYLNHRLAKAEASARKATKELKADEDKYMKEFEQQLKEVSGVRTLVESKMEELHQMIERGDT